jgi:DNA-binding NarL/FixJ family response regulator
VELLGSYSNSRQPLERLHRLLKTPPARSSDEPKRKQRQLQRRLNPDQQAELLERYLAGERAYQLAQAFGVHHTTVAKLLIDNDVRRPRSLTTEEVAKSIELYRQGWSCHRIAEQLGRHDGTIWLALKKAGVTLRPPWARGAR